MIEMNDLGNVILKNIDDHDQPFRMQRSPPRIAKKFQIRKSQRFDKSDTDISDLIIECFNRDESCQK